tara:strand:+ start:138 stop:368 length:231 start_codon:yes stop_codon:yes gene_type:complete
MQKLFNVLSVTAFVMSGTMVAATVMFYTRIPSLTKYYMSELTLEMTKAMSKMMPKKIETKVPKMPTETGLPIKSPF